MRRVADEQRAGVVVEHREDEPEDLPIRLLRRGAASTSSRESSWSVRSSASRASAAAARSIARPSRIEMSDRQAEEHEQHDHVLGLPDHERPVRREEEEVEDDEAEDRGDDPRSDPADPRGGDHDDQEPEPLGRAASMSSRNGQEERRRARAVPAIADRVRQRPAGVAARTASAGACGPATDRSVGSCRTSGPVAIAKHPTRRRGERGPRAQSSRIPYADRRLPYGSLTRRGLA